MTRTGRAWFKRVAVLILASPAALMLWYLARHQLGPEPVTELIYRTGLWTVRILLLTLAVTPARFAFGLTALPALRRTIGLSAMGYGLAHLALYVVQQGGSLIHVGHEITHRVYLAIGFTALLGLAVLGLTSTDDVIRRLGRRWKTLHRFIFPMAALALLHFFMQSKVDVSSAATYGGLFLFLAGWRALPRRWAERPIALLALALMASVCTAELEAGWYDVATRIAPARVLAAELTWRFGPRPASRVLLATLAVTIAATLIALLRRGSMRGRTSPPPGLARS